MLLEVITSTHLTYLVFNDLKLNSLLVESVSSFVDGNYRQI